MKELIWINEGCSHLTERSPTPAKLFLGQQNIFFTSVKKFASKFVTHNLKGSLQWLSLSLFFQSIILTGFRFGKFQYEIRYET